MAKKFKLKERGTGEVIYPVTSSNCVLHDGQQLDAIIDRKADVTELSNVIAEHPVDDDNFDKYSEITREQLKKDLFIDLWNTACGTYGKYNADTGFFELNGLTDITYEQALTIYDEKGNFFEYGKTIKGRTNIFIDTPNVLKYTMSYDISFYIKFQNSPVEIISLYDNIVGLKGNCQTIHEHFLTITFQPNYVII